MEKQKITQKTTQITQKIISQPLIKKTMRVQIIGESDLLMNKMSEDTKELLKNKVEGKATQKVNRELDKEAEIKIHYDNKGNVIMPTFAFKAAMVEAAPYLQNMDKKLAKSIIVEGDFVSLKYKSKYIREDFGKPQRGGTPLPIRRPAFKDWNCELVLTFNSSQITPESIINLLRLAGFHNGVGAWRPACQGQFGRFDVKTN
jgi:hypothetical protein